MNVSLELHFIFRFLSDLSDPDFFLLSNNIILSVCRLIDIIYYINYIAQ